MEPFEPSAITPKPLPSDPNWLPEEDQEAKANEPQALTTYEQIQLEELAKQFKLTPATQAFFLENRKVGRNAPLKWFPAPFLQHVSSKIAVGVAKGNARIILSAPPRHGKSKLSTEHGPLWCLENFDNRNVVTATYGADLAEDFARNIRDHITQNPDVLDVRLRTDANRIAKFLTNTGGALTSIGLGGPITGRGADILFIDDYIKQIKEANSQAYRDFCWDWFRSTAMTRLEPNASVVIVATRWHHDDLIGRIIREFGTAEEGGDWQYIKYHAIARENDPLGRQPGEALFPQRYSVKTLNERRKLLGSLYFDALFDQEPHTSTTDITKKEWILIRKPSEMTDLGPIRLVRVHDFAGSKSDKSDYTASGLLCGNSLTKDCGLLNMIRKKNTAAENEKLVAEIAEADGPQVAIVICQETGSAGKAVVSHYQNNVLRGYKVTGHYWNTGKEIVAQAWLAACESGHFWMLEAAWNKDFLDEFGSFPAEGSGYHDDQMDVCANGYIYLFGKAKKAGTFGRHSIAKKSHLPADPAEAARILKENEENFRRKAINSPHLLLKTVKQGVVVGQSRATFGRRSKITLN